MPFMKPIFGIKKNVTSFTYIQRFRIIPGMMVVCVGSLCPSTVMVVVLSLSLCHPDKCIIIWCL